MDILDYFKGKKITVMGLGVLGRGIGDTAFLAKYAADIIVTDLKTKDELKDSLKDLEAYPDIKYVLGEHRLEDFRDRDMILKAAGVPLDSPYVAEALKNNIPVEMSASLVTQFSEAIIVGVTGTRGKSTVTHLIHHILRAAKKDVCLGGNVRGIGTLELLNKTGKGSVIVMELDSWQLQGFGTVHISPDIAVFTTFLPDHMVYYKNSMEDYWNDKVNIFKWQTKEQQLIIGKNVAKRINKEKPKSSVTVTSSKKLPKDWNLKILGEHNRDNVSLAIEVVRILNIDENIIKEAVEGFDGVPGRLQFVKEVKGVKIYNDNSATTPEATIAALLALGDDIVLIMGGFDKGLDMKSLISEIPKHCKAVVLFKENGTDRILGDVKKLNGVDVYEEESLVNCVKKAISITELGDTLLYSPAFASFGKYFKNEYDRNDQFMALVKKL
ncbi:UDP-N-acetylmuramoyl-L-alanine--D-glutamate ligase [Patescibacteria group bacterium]|nr:UDP-N-acetylmuramoyl-L-alanine--D-glutamate ligase [Patescibacteria group bacterium]